jgi:hypothetical protein
MASFDSFPAAGAAVTGEEYGLSGEAWTMTTATEQHRTPLGLFAEKPVPSLYDPRSAPMCSTGAGVEFTVRPIGRSAIPRSARLNRGLG